MKTIAIFPGTFDPLTNGHVDLVQRTARQFDTIIVSVAENAQKKPLFTLPERVVLAQQALAHVPGVQVAGFSNLLVEFAQLGDIVCQAKKSSRDYSRT